MPWTGFLNIVGLVVAILLKILENRSNFCDTLSSSAAHTGVRRLQPHRQDHPGHLVPIRPESNHCQVHREEAAFVPIHHHGEGILLCQEWNVLAISLSRRQIILDGDISHHQSMNGIVIIKVFTLRMRSE